MPDTVVPQLSTESNQRIKTIVKLHYGFCPQDSDIARIDDVVRNHYIVLHDQHMVLELVAHEISKPLLKHRDRLGSIAYEQIMLDKTIFKYLAYASMCFRTGIPAGTIALCRTALETGLRERLAEELASGADSSDDCANLVKKKVHQLRMRSIHNLVGNLEEREIISNADFEGQFKPLKLGDQSARKVLDKIIHGDIAWVVDLAADKGLDTNVSGVKDTLQESKIIADIHLNKLAFEILRGSYGIAEMLFFSH